MLSVLVLFRGDDGGKEWSSCYGQIEVDDARPGVWPVVKGVTGVAHGGSTVVVNLNRIPENMGTQPRIASRLVGPVDNDVQVLSRRTFDLNIPVPPGLKEIELQLALEAPQVFQFDVLLDQEPK